MITIPGEGTARTARIVAACGLGLVAASIVMQARAGVDFLTVPPALVVSLALGVGLLVVRRRWVLLLGLQLIGTAVAAAASLVALLAARRRSGGGTAVRPVCDRRARDVEGVRGSGGVT